MSDIRWEGLTHEQIYTAVHQGPGAAVSKPAEDAWRETEALIMRIDQRIASAMAGSQAGWEGSAADATRSAMTPLGQWALDAARNARLTAGAVVGQGLFAKHVRDNMPEPVTEQRNGAIEGALTDPTFIFHGLDDLQAVEQDAANRAARAVELMNGYTDNSEGNRQFWVPAPFPPQVTVVTDPAAAGPGGPGVPGVPGTPAPTPPADVASPSPGGTPPLSPTGTPPLPPTGTPPATPTGTPPAAAPPRPPRGASPGAPDSAGAPNDRAPIPPAVAPPAPGQPPGGTPAATVPAGPAGPGLPPAPSATPPGTAVIPPGPTARPGSTPPGGGPRPVVPGPPRTAPQPSWRDVVPSGPAAPGTRFPGPGAAVPDQVLPRTGPEATGTRTVTEPATRAVAAAPRASGPGAMGGMYPPLAAGAGAGSERERRRPDYLLDDSDAFADDRWFTPAVITPDDGPPPTR